MDGIHGYVGTIGPANNLNYFTGSSYSAYLDRAKVFKTEGGAKNAMRYWQTADHNPSPLGDVFWASRSVAAVELHRWDN